MSYGTNHLIINTCNSFNITKTYKYSLILIIPYIIILLEN